MDKTLLEIIQSKEKECANEMMDCINYASIYYPEVKLDGETLGDWKKEIKEHIKSKLVNFRKE